MFFSIAPEAIDLLCISVSSDCAFSRLISYSTQHGKSTVRSLTLVFARSIASKVAAIVVAFSTATACSRRCKNKTAVVLRNEPFTLR